MVINIAIEKIRGCGYRKINGLYLVGRGFPVSCDRLPYILDICPTCGHGIKPNEGFTWINGLNFFKNNCKGKSECHPDCPICFPKDERYGLMWVGNSFYTPSSFIEEGKKLGVCKRIPFLPKQLVLGESWVLLAHRKAGMKKMKDKNSLTGENEKVCNAIFYSFKPERAEMLITESKSKNKRFVHKLIRRSITPIIVPDDDTDHQGDVWKDLAKKLKEERLKKIKKLDEVIKK